MDTMEEEFVGRLKQCAKYVNAHYKVAKVCLAFPDRVRELKKAKGERLKNR